MILIVDTNIILSALIKDSITRRLIVELDLKLMAPEFVFNEINKYKYLILKKSGLTEEELILLLNKIFSYIGIISNGSSNKFKNKANKIIGNIDKKDAIFIAASLSKNKSPIWTDDRHFKKQKEITTYTTSEIINYFYK